MDKKTNKKEFIRWAIYGDQGLYTGQYLTRYDAIKDHTIALGKDWKYCKDKGDVAVKVKISIL